MAETYILNKITRISKIFFFENGGLYLILIGGILRGLLTKFSSGSSAIIILCSRVKNTWLRESELDTCA